MVVPSPPLQGRKWTLRGDTGSEVGETGGTADLNKASAGIDDNEDPRIQCVRDLIKKGGGRATGADIGQRFKAKDYQPLPEGMRLRNWLAQYEEFQVIEPWPSSAHFHVKLRSEESAEEVPSASTANGGGREAQADIRVQAPRYRSQQQPGHWEGPPDGERPSPSGGVQCKYFAKGVCNRGAACQFAHSQSSAPMRVWREKTEPTMGREQDQNDMEGRRDEPCFNFFKGACFRGDACIRSHSRSDQMCPFFQANGWCKFGDECAYAHYQELLPKEAGPEGSSASAEHGWGYDYASQMPGQEASPNLGDGFHGPASLYGADVLVPEEAYPALSGAGLLPWSYKTKLCHHWQACRKGAQCTFAHSIEELEHFKRRRMEQEWQQQVLPPNQWYLASSTNMPSSLLVDMRVPYQEAEEHALEPQNTSGSIAAHVAVTVNTNSRSNQDGQPVEREIPEAPSEIGEAHSPPVPIPEGGEDALSEASPISRAASDYSADERISHAAPVSSGDPTEEVEAAQPRTQMPPEVLPPVNAVDVGLEVFAKKLSFENGISITVSGLLPEEEFKEFQAKEEEPRLPLPEGLMQFSPVVKLLPHRKQPFAVHPALTLPYLQELRQCLPPGTSLAFYKLEEEKTKWERVEGGRFGKNQASIRLRDFCQVVVVKETYPECTIVVHPFIDPTAREKDHRARLLLVTKECPLCLAKAETRCAQYTEEGFLPLQKEEIDLTTRESYKIFIKPVTAEGQAAGGQAAECPYTHTVTRRDLKLTFYKDSIWYQVDIEGTSTQVIFPVQGPGVNTVAFLDGGSVRELLELQEHTKPAVATCPQELTQALDGDRIHLLTVSLKSFTDKTNKDEDVMTADDVLVGYDSILAFFKNRVAEGKANPECIVLLLRFGKKLAAKFFEKSGRPCAGVDSVVYWNERLADNGMDTLEKNPEAARLLCRYLPQEIKKQLVKSGMGNDRAWLYREALCETIKCLQNDPSYDWGRHGQDRFQSFPTLDQLQKRPRPSPAPLAQSDDAFSEASMSLPRSEPRSTRELPRADTGGAEAYQ